MPTPKLGKIWNRRPILAVLSLLCLSAAAFAQGLPPNNSAPPAPPSKVEAPKVVQGAADTGPVAVDPRTYLIGPEDILFLKVWREPDFTGGVAVRPDGKITIPLVGDLQAEGLTPERLAAQLKDALSAYINAPEVTVSVNQVNSKRFTITGQVNRSGVFPLVVPITVFDALGAAGGFRDFANTKNVVIIRGNKRIKFNYQEVLKGKKLDQNIYLENGDTVNVP